MFEMNNDLILMPLIAMFMLTYFVGVWMVKLRFKAVKEDGLNPGYFQTNRGAKLPDYLAKVTNHYVNLFELPVLFYVVCVVIYAGNKVDAIYITLAWIFVIIRCAHAYIHTTYNNLRHRRNTFLYGSLVLALMWVRLATEVISTISN
jgi:hypothetical protein